MFLFLALVLFPFSVILDAFALDVAIHSLFNPLYYCVLPWQHKKIQIVRPTFKLKLCYFVLDFQHFSNWHSAILEAEGAEKSKLETTIWVWLLTLLCLWKCDTWYVIATILIKHSMTFSWLLTLYIDIIEWKKLEGR